MKSTSRSSTDLASSINSFIEAKRIDRGAADRTTEAYRRDLTQMAEWLPSTATQKTISEADLRKYLRFLHETGCKPASVARKLSAIRQFFKFCAQELGLRENPADQLESPQRPQRLPKFLTPEQVTRLLRAADDGIPYPDSRGEAFRARDCAMVYLLYASGLRVSELVGLTLHDIDLAAGYSRVTGKGDKQRIAPFAPVAGEKLRHYLDHHRATLEPATEHLFLNNRGFALTRQALWKLLKTLAIQADLSAEISPHVLRHSFATHLLESGMNLRSLQMLLGHSDLSTTQIYTHITPSHLKTAHRRFHPRGDTDADD